MRLKLVHASYIGDWYTIERAVHDGREWWEETGPNSISLRMSCRITDACVEGTLSEMKAIAKAIRSRSDIAFKRCAVKITKAGGQFWSPRNSRVKSAICSMRQIDDLAAQIEQAK